MALSFEDWYRQIPIVTRGYLTLAVATTLLCALDVVSPFSLYFNWTAIVNKYEVWRLVTNFLFFGLFGLDYVFHMFFLVRYCRLLEENTFRGRTADFFFMLVFGATLMTVMAPFLNVHFLGSSLTFMMVYVWGYLNEHVRMSFLGLFNFNAPYLPWVLLFFSLLLGASPVMDLLGVAAGHIYYFLEFVYPRMRGIRLLKTPMVIKYLFEAEQAPVQPLVEPIPQQENVNENDAYANPLDMVAEDLPAANPGGDGQEAQ